MFDYFSTHTYVHFQSEAITAVLAYAMETISNRFITSTINQQIHLYDFHLKHLKPLRLVSILSDHHQGVSSFLAKVITYSRFSSFL